MSLPEFRTYMSLKNAEFLDIFYIYENLKLHA